MATYNGANLTLLTQGISGNGKTWYYTDTGPVADFADSDGVVTDGKARGIRAGDRINYYDSSRKWSYNIGVFSVQDTGGTTVTLGTAVLASDTS